MFFFFIDEAVSEDLVHLSSYKSRKHSPSPHEASGLDVSKLDYRLEVVGMKLNRTIPVCW